MNQYPNQIRLVYRNFSVGHALSSFGIQAAEAAALQGKYWEMHDVLFDSVTWQTWVSMTEADFTTWVTQKAGTLGMDTTKFAADLKSQAVVDKVTTDTNAAVAAGLNSTPSMFVLFNNDLYFAPAEQLPFTYLPAIFQLWQLQTRQFKSCPPTTVDTSKTYTATLTNPNPPKYEFVPAGGKISTADLSDVTASTVFSMVGGTCTGAVCTPSTAGDHPVSGTYGSATGSVTLHTPAAPATPTPAPTAAPTAAPTPPPTSTNSSSGGGGSPLMVLFLMALTGASVTLFTVRRLIRGRR